MEPWIFSQGWAQEGIIREACPGTSNKKHIEESVKTLGVDTQSPLLFAPCTNDLSNDGDRTSLPFLPGRGVDKGAMSRSPSACVSPLVR